MSSPAAPRLDIALLVLLAFLWGSSFTLIEVALDTVPPATIVAGRLTLAAVVLLVLVAIRRLPLPKTPRRWGALAGQGALQTALPFSLISWGQQHIDSGMASLLSTTPPLFVFLIGFVLLKERAAAGRKLLGVTLGFSGVLAIMGPAALLSKDSQLAGQLAVVAASLCYGLSALNARRFADQPALVTAACSMGFGALLMIPIALAVDAPLSLAPDARALAAIAAMGLLSTALASVLFFRLVRTLGPLGVTTGSYMRAGFSILLGTWLLGEAVTPALAIGLMLIFLGVALVTGLLRPPRTRGFPG